MSGEAQWDLNVAIIQDLLYGPLPLWLSEPWPVTLDNVHGGSQSAKLFGQPR